MTAEEESGDPTAVESDEAKEEQTTDENESSADGAEAAEPGDEASTESEPAGDEKSPEFQDLQEASQGAQSADIQMFDDVQVKITAEIGRRQIPIKDLLGMSVGSVIELERDVSEPVELYTQGVPFGNGDVVVIDDRFAVRIKEIYSGQSR